MAGAGTAPALGNGHTADGFERGIEWEQGQHATLIGETGSGKTYLARFLLRRRRYALALITKKEDETLAEFKQDGFERIRDWKDGDAYKYTIGVETRRLLLWPPIKNEEDILKQRAVYERALWDIYRTGAWCVYIDELWYIAKFLNLERIVNLLLLQGRSERLSVLAATQRPRHVPLTAYSQPSHLFAFASSDAQDARRLREFGLGEVNLETLQRYEAVHLDKPRREVRTVIAPSPGEGG